MQTSELLINLHRQGFTLTPLPDGKLEVKPASKLTDSLREELKRCKAEVLALLTRPYINAQGELIIPFDCDPRYHFWKPGGQSIAETLTELNVPSEVWRRYVVGYTETVQ